MNVKIRIQRLRSKRAPPGNRNRYKDSHLGDKNVSTPSRPGACSPYRMGMRSARRAPIGAKCGKKAAAATAATSYGIAAQVTQSVARAARQHTTVATAHKPTSRQRRFFVR